MISLLSLALAGDLGELAGGGHYLAPAKPTALTRSQEVLWDLRNGMVYSSRYPVTVDNTKVSVYNIDQQTCNNTIELAKKNKIELRYYLENGQPHKNKCDKEKNILVYIKDYSFLTGKKIWINF